MSRRIASGISLERAAIPTGSGSDSGRWPPARKLRTRVRGRWTCFGTGRPTVDANSRPRLVRRRHVGHRTRRTARARSSGKNVSGPVRWCVHRYRTGSSSAGGVALLGAQAPPSDRAASGARQCCNADAFRPGGPVGSAGDGLHTLAARDSASDLDRLAVASTDSASASAASPGMSTTLPSTPPATRS
jgi:hypothetical protein